MALLAVGSAIVVTSLYPQQLRIFLLANDLGSRNELESLSFVGGPFISGLFSSSSPLTVAFLISFIIIYPF